MNNQQPFWYQDQDGYYYDNHFKRGLMYKEFVTKHPDLNDNFNPSRWAYIHDTSGNFQFKREMVSDPLEAYVNVYNNYRTLSNNNNRTESEDELMKRQKRLLRLIRGSFNAMNYVKNEIPIMKVDSSTEQLLNEQEIRLALNNL